MLPTCAPDRLNHALHGKRSEKLAEDERQLAVEDLSIALAEVEAEKEILAAKADTGKIEPAPKRAIGNLPAARPRIEEIIEPTSLDCPAAAVSCTRSVKTAANSWTSFRPSCAARQTG